MAATTFSKILFENATLRITDIHWRAHDCGPSQEYVSPLGEITFQRRGMFVKHYGPQRVACDPNTLIFINPDEPYRMSHPAPLDCACTALLLTPAALREILGEFRPAARDARKNPFYCVDCPSDGTLNAAHRALYRLASRAETADSLEVEERALALARRTVAAAARFHGRRPGALRTGTARHYRELVRAVKEVLAARFEQGVALDDLAARVHCAPTHLCRIFKGETGLPIHRYLNRLRLAAALEFLEDPQTNLARLAVALGFTHHSHFTNAFRREFGASPNEFRRRRPPPAARREMRKILQA